MRHTDLLLPARAPASYLQWRACRGEEVPEPGTLVFEVAPDNFRSFASFRSVIGQLEGLGAEVGELKEISGLLADLGEGKDESHSLEDAALQQRGVLAALRRISRESAQVCTLMHRAAQALLDATSSLAHRGLVLPSVDRLDRASIKIFGRACLLVPATPRQRWQWWFTGAQPAVAAPVAEVRELWLRARRNLFAVLENILRPQIASDLAGAGDLSAGDLSAGDLSNPNERAEITADFRLTSMATACAWLAHQNYDACFLWAAARSDYPHAGSAGFVDLRRLLAIAATNVGEYDQSLLFLNEAYRKCGQATLRAHLAYMQGLVLAKRKRDLRSSAAWYEQGLLELDHVTAADPGDCNMERAWIYNGMALNTLLAARQEGRPPRSVFRETYNRVVQAFSLVREGETSDRMYLRYNLLGNMGSLMEIQGEYAVALKLAEETFDPALADGLANGKEWRAMLESRRGMLYSALGDVDRATKLFAAALSLILGHGCVLRAELLQRSLGILHLRARKWSKALEFFSEGLEKALELRSRPGALTHGRGLVVALRQARRSAGARAVYQRLLDGEGICLGTVGRSARQAVEELEPPSKLHGLVLSFPEIDLEELAPVSVAGVLRGDVAFESGAAPPPA